MTIEQLKSRLARQLENMGWNDEGIYDRDWKKAVAETKRRIKEMEKAQ